MREDLYLLLNTGVYSDSLTRITRLARFGRITSYIFTMASASQDDPDPPDPGIITITYPPRDIDHRLIDDSIREGPKNWEEELEERETGGGGDEPSGPEPSYQEFPDYGPAWEVPPLNPDGTPNPIWPGWDVDVWPVNIDPTPFDLPGRFVRPGQIINPDESDPKFRQIVPSVEPDTDRIPPAYSHPDGRRLYWDGSTWWMRDVHGRWWFYPRNKTRDYYDRRWRRFYPGFGVPIDVVPNPDRFSSPNLYPTGMPTNPEDFTPKPNPLGIRPFQSSPSDRNIEDFFPPEIIPNNEPRGSPIRLPGSPGNTRWEEQNPNWKRDRFFSGIDVLVESGFDVEATEALRLYLLIGG